MSNIDVIAKFNAGELTLEEANKKLTGIKLLPGRNELTEAEQRATTVGYYPDQANGWGLLDSGTGFMDKVKVENGRIVSGGMGEAEALCVIGGKVYKVADDVLVED